MLRSLSALTAAASAAHLPWPTSALQTPGSPLAGSLVAAGAGRASGPADYDVLRMMDALVRAGVDHAAIDQLANTVGHLAVLSLDVMKQCGVQPADVMKARRLYAQLEAPFKLGRSRDWEEPVRLSPPL